MPSITLDNSTTLHYAERHTEGGSGKRCIVLIHGFPVDGRMWDSVLRESPNARVITPDLTGFGQSKSDRPFSIESLADDLHHLLLKLNVCPIVLGGFSMGGYVSLAYAKKYPMDLAGLMLIDTRAEGDSAEGKEKRNKMISLVREKGAKAVADQMLPNMLTKAGVNDAKLASSVRSLMEACPAKTIEHALLALRDRTDQTQMLASIAFPTLIVVGDQDTLTPPSAAEAMNKAIPRSKLVTINGAAHLAPMERPAEVSRAITEFIASL